MSTVHETAALLPDPAELRPAGGEVTYDAGHTPGARFVVSLPTG